MKKKQGTHTQRNEMEQRKGRGTRIVNKAWTFKENQHSEEKKRAKGQTKTQSKRESKDGVSFTDESEREPESFSENKDLRTFPPCDL